MVVVRQRGWRGPPARGCGRRGGDAAGRERGAGEDDTREGSRRGHAARRRRVRAVRAAQTTGRGAGQIQQQIQQRRCAHQSTDGGDRRGRGW